MILTNNTRYKLNIFYQQKSSTPKTNKYKYSIYLLASIFEFNYLKIV